MRWSREPWMSTTLIAVLASLGGCANEVVGARAGADHVAVMEASQVANCQSKGKIHATVFAKVGPLPRLPEAVESNLLLLARNGAIDNGGDTLVKGASTEFGKRAFEVYKCRP